MTERIDTYENVTYICLLRCHDHRKPYSLRPRAKNRILTYFPKYSPEDTENFGRAKLILHHPFRELRIFSISPTFITRHTARSLKHMLNARLCVEIRTTAIVFRILKTTLDFVKWTVSIGVIVFASTLIWMGTGRSAWSMTSQSPPGDQRLV